jgi:hypothetical protein
VDLFGWLRKKKPELPHDEALSVLELSLQRQKMEADQRKNQNAPPLVDVLVGITSRLEPIAGEFQVGGSPVGLQPEQWPIAPSGDRLNFIASIPLDRLPSNPIASMTASVFMARTYADDDTVVET